MNRWSTDQVLALAPDAPSKKAAVKLSSPKPWSGTGLADAAEGPLLWGECQGSGKKPYRTAVHLTAEPASHCSCPSRKFPCKHALALLLLWSEGGIPGAGADEPAPWAAEWLAERRGRADRKAARAERAASGAAPSTDPEAARKRAAKRAARVASGAEDLERRLADRLRAGLAGEDTAARSGWEDVARRMVDAQAPGLASRVRELAAVPASGPGWPSRLLEEYGLLHLLAAGYAHEAALPEPLAATVRARIGFTVPKEEVLASGERVADRWLVLGRQDTADEHQLTTRRIWLHGSSSGRTALLLGFARPGQAPQPALPVGGTVEAELAFHPGAYPLRAEPVSGLAPVPEGPAPGGVSTAEAASAHAAALVDDPWLEAVPVVLGRVVPVRTEEGWALTDASGTVPVARAFAGSGALWRLVALAGGAAVAVFGELGHGGVAPYTAWGADPRPADLTEAGALQVA